MLYVPLHTGKLCPTGGAFSTKEASQHRIEGRARALLRRLPAWSVVVGDKKRGRGGGRSIEVKGIVAFCETAIGVQRSPAGESTQYSLARSFLEKKAKVEEVNAGMIPPVEWVEYHECTLLYQARRKEIHSRV